jgi:hypothetical protein
MLFNSLEFLKFFLLVFAAYWALPLLFAGPAWRRVLLGAALVGGSALYASAGSGPPMDPWVALFADPPAPGADQPPPRPSVDLFPHWKQQVIAADATLHGGLAALYRVPWECWLAGFLSALVVVCLAAGSRWSPHPARVWLLLGCSLYFYASWNSWLALLIGVTSALDWLIGLGMDLTAVTWRRRFLLGLSLVVNLGLLARRACRC